jgi:hypothetical protein
VNTHSTGTDVPGKEKINSVTYQKIWKKNSVFIEMFKYSYPLHTTADGFLPPFAWLAGQCFFQFYELNISFLVKGLLARLSSMISSSFMSYQAISFASSGFLGFKNCAIKQTAHTCNLSKLLYD